MRASRITRYRIAIMAYPIRAGISVANNCARRSKNHRKLKYAAMRNPEYALPECERKRKRLKPADDISLRRIAVLDRVLEACN